MADPKKLKQLASVNRGEILFSIARLQDNTVISGGSDGCLYRADLSAEKIEPEAFEGHQSYVTGVGVVDDQIVSCSYDKKLIWRNRETGEITRTIENAHARWMRGLVVSPNGKWLATVADDMVCRIWDAKTGERKHELKGHAETTPHHYPSMLYACAISPDSKHVATVDRIGKVMVWDLEKGSKLSEYEASEMYTWDPTMRRHSIGGVRSVAFSPDGHQLAVGGMGQVGNIDHLGGKARVEVFDWQQGEQVQLFDDPGYKGLVEQVIYSPDGKWLLAVGGDHNGFIIFMDIATKKNLKDEKFDKHIHAAVVNEDWSRIYFAAHERLAMFEV